MAVDSLRAAGKKVAVTASTGIAAANLCSRTLQAVTIHRFTGYYVYFVVIHAESHLS
jgi:hypothetical protein